MRHMAEMQRVVAQSKQAHDSEIQALQLQLDETRTSSSQDSQLVRQITGQLADANSRVEALEAQLEQQGSVQQARVGDLQFKLQSTSTEYSQLQSERAVASQQLGRAVQQIGAQADQIGDLKCQFQSESAARRQAEALREEQTTAMRELETENAQLLRELELQDDEDERQAAEVASLEARCQEQESQLLRAEAKLETASKQSEDLLRQLSQQEATHEDQEHSLRNELSRMAQDMQQIAAESDSEMNKMRADGAKQHEGHVAKTKDAERIRGERDSAVAQRDRSVRQQESLVRELRESQQQVASLERARESLRAQATTRLVLLD